MIIVDFIRRWFNANLFFNDDFGSSSKVFGFPIHPTILCASTNLMSLFFAENRSNVTTDLTLSFNLSTEVLRGRSSSSGVENWQLLTLTSWEGLTYFLVVCLTCILKRSLKWLWWKCFCTITSVTLLMCRGQFKPRAVLSPSIINGFWEILSQSLSSIK